MLAGSGKLRLPVHNSRRDLKEALGIKTAGAIAVISIGDVAPMRAARSVAVTVTAGVIVLDKYTLAHVVLSATSGTDPFKSCMT